MINIKTILKAVLTNFLLFYLLVVSDFCYHFTSGNVEILDWDLVVSDFCYHFTSGHVEILDWDLHTCAL